MPTTNAHIGYSLRGIYLWQEYLDMGDASPQKPWFSLCENQRKFFERKTAEILAHKETYPNERLLECLRKVWIDYDNGGISVGRSARACLLEATMDYIKTDQMDKARTSLSMLLAMYHDVGHINASQWIQFPVDNPFDTGLDHISHLVTAGFMLGLDTLPSIAGMSIKEVLLASGEFV